MKKCLPANIAREKDAIIDAILENPVYTRDSGLVFLARLNLRKLSLQALHGINTIVHLKTTIPCKCDDKGKGQYHLPGCPLYVVPKGSTQAQVDAMARVGCEESVQNPVLHTDNLSTFKR